MALSIFDDKSKPPTEADLARVLKTNCIHWNEIKAFILKHYPAAKEEWNYSGKNYGWGFRLRDTKRVIVYMTPCDGYFLLSMVFGEKATKEALDSKLSNEIVSIINNAKVYAEGRGIRMEVKDETLLEDIKKLIVIKLKY
jgi:hypothetical protein